MRIIFLLLLSFIYTNAFADGTTKVFAVCKGDETLKMSPKEFVQSLKTSGLKGTELGNNISCGGKVSVLGPSEGFETSNFFSIEFSDADLYNYMKKQEAEFKAKKTTIEPPKNLAEVFFRFQFETAGACDILVPSRFKIVTEKMLAPAPAAPKAQDQRSVR